MLTILPALGGYLYAILSGQVVQSYACQIRALGRHVAKTHVVSTGLGLAMIMAVIRASAGQ